MSEGPDKRIRVLVVDDSAFARKVVREVLARAPEIDVVDVARDGLEALEKIEALKPDLVTLDLMMPNLDGLGVLRALPKDGGPRVLVVTFSAVDSESGAEALQLGALDLVKKPTALATDQMYDLSRELVDKVRALMDATPAALDLDALKPAVRPAPPPAKEIVTRFRLVAVGTSTGGPQALTRLITTLPANFPVPMVVALHIPAGYTNALARRLDEACDLPVCEVRDGQPLLPGHVYIAQGGLHVKISRLEDRLVAMVDMRPLDAPYTPSVNVLFATAVAALKQDVLGVVLTGMGDDGLQGARDIRAAGGYVLTESPNSAVIYGMPRVVREAGLSQGEAEIDAMGAAIVRALQRD